ncbi:MAG: benzoyl-CoA reductase subunit C [Bacteroidetes bacterium]|nr:MAG: benzoyl-CoA reductase subunit C [Bacteroidota bacterium]
MKYLNILDSLTEIISRCEELDFDLKFTRAKEWKSLDKTRVLVGYMPIYIPREVVHAANGLAIGILGGGDKKLIIKGDAYYQSYICHMPRSILELVMDGHFEGFDGFIFPSICDVIRNLSGMFQLLGKGRFIKYLDLPQNFKRHIGGEFYKQELQHILEEIYKINGVEVTSERLCHSILMFNKNRRLTEQIYTIRQEFPWRMTAADLYHIVRAGYVIPVEEHNEILENVIRLIQEERGDPLDKIRVMVIGAFCEQPPVGLIRTIEMAGCYIVEDDFLLGARWIQGDIDPAGTDPLSAISNAYLEKSTFSSSVYDVDNPKEGRMIKLMTDRKADGIIFAAPSFCDPALLDHPMLQKACNDKNIRFISFLYSENTGQFKVIKEQVGTFSDSIKLWDEPVLSGNKE